ncbi:MAG: TonB-dependent receptor [Candidatus Dadabacteria bacterium]|nr:TonB-dependent receptor [Candidatus Dadabacteria bacterium]MXZ48593.1 TonB-dependent receptor [Candidatus Dadabacteria bacterium]MYB27211.1 TonB-dependent receptor [Candidatus Dadabacteria bacterium]
MNRLKIFFAFILILALFPSAGFSEENRAEKIVVTGTKTWIDAERLGSTVTVIDREEIEKSGEKDISSILSRVAGFNVVGTGSRGGNSSIFVRGGQSDYNLVMINGVQINQAGGGFDISSLTTENIERIEIIKGAHSSLYGSDAASSVINIITKRGSGKMKKASSVALGFRAEDAMILEHSSSISGSFEKLGYFISHQRIIDEGILEINNDYKNNNFTANLSLEASDNLNLSFFSIYRDSKFEFPTAGAGDRLDAFADPDSQTKEKSLVTGSDIVFSPTQWWENSFKIGYMKLDRESYDGPEPIELDGSESEFDTLDKRISLEYGSSFFVDFDQISSVTSTGFEYEKESFETDSLDESRKNYAFYAQNNFGLLNMFFVTAGIRYDDNEAFGGEWSPSVFAKWKIKESGTEIRGGISRGIKEANFFENFSTAFGTIPNPDLKPEEALTAEVGFNQPLFDNTVELDLSFFQNKFKNIIAYSFTPFENGTNYENISRAKSEGAEAAIRFYPSSVLTLSAAYTYVKTEVNDDGGLGSPSFSKGERLVRIPEHSFSFNTGYSKNAFDFSLSGNYVGSRDDVDWSGFPSTRVKNDSFFLVDVATSYEISVKRFVDKIKLFSRINNLFNEDYENVFGFSSPGFSMISGVSIVR